MAEYAARQRSRFSSIEAARAIAALGVVISHAALITAEPRYWGVMPFGGALKNLAAGVDFFFVLSGFIITTVHWDDVGKPDRLGHYAKRRFLRIFPLYWSVLIPIAIVYQIKPSFGVPWQHDPYNLFLSFFLLPNPDLPILGVAWTLTFEMFFYLMFGLAIACGTHWVKVIVAWGIAIILAQIVYADIPFPFSFFLNARNLEFLVGMACGIYLRNHNAPRPPVFLSVGIAAFAAGIAFVPEFASEQDLEIVSTLVFGTASALMVLGLIGVERVGWFKRCEQAFLAGGACSYAIYLVHPTAESFLARPAMALGQGLSAETTATLLALGGAAAGIAAHYIIELPATTCVRRILDFAPTGKPVGTRAP